MFLVLLWVISFARNFLLSLFIQGVSQKIPLGPNWEFIELRVGRFGGLL